MLHLPPFEYVAADSLAAAAKVLARYGDDARLLAGGTDLLPRMKRRVDTPAVLVGLRGVAGLGAWEASADGWRLGAGVTLNVLATGAGGGPGGQALAVPRVLGQAAAAVATPALRRMGTLGGNLCQDSRCSFFDQSAFWRGALGGCMKCQGTVCRVAPGSDRCWAVSTSDLAPALMVLDAQVLIVGPEAERTVSVEGLYTGDGERPLALARGEIVAQVMVPAAPGSGSTYRKLRPRRSFDFPSLGVAVRLRGDDGRVAEARIALAAVASAPVRVTAAEEGLVGQRPDPALFEAAAEEAFRQATPMANADLVPAYRKKMVRVYVAAALADAWSTVSPAAGPGTGPPATAAP